MTVPADAKIIRNKFGTKCFACKSTLDGEAGAAILLTGDIRWRAYHTTCLPPPFEVADIPANVTIGHGPRHPTTNPAHARCATCSHWQADHTNITGVVNCIGHFRGAPGCTCTGYVDPTTLTVQPLGAGYAITTNTITIPTSQVSFTPPEDDDTLPEAYALKRGRGTTARLVIFAGPMKPHYDWVSVATVISAHGLTPSNPPDCTIVCYVGADGKRDYSPQPEDFVMGPHTSVDDYRQAKSALAAWLLEKGITFAS